MVLVVLRQFLITLLQTLTCSTTIWRSFSSKDSVSTSQSQDGQLSSSFESSELVSFVSLQKIEVCATEIYIYIDNYTLPSKFGI